ACATALTKAALLALITNEERETSTIHLPIGRDATFTIEKCLFENNAVSCETIKDAGDDPDATHQALIVDTVCWAETPGIHLDGGIGV
ncbi:cobalt-precorrin-5B (C(1))-methyltransferase, partial [Lysinibacillus sp. D4A3_S15]|uniref:cobalt-precorrin-5B (C(1))-methyltransferase n=1 Tax=Lysinibacillus sp. D4A3_S15 TaxID=2941227 RepID=UPI0020C0F98A